MADATSSDTPGTSVPQLLPADTPDFTGRGELGERLCDLLSAGDDPPAEGSAPSVPLMAVAGPGGVGKTTLAVHLAHRLQNDFPDGRLYLNLRGAGAQPLSPDHLLEWCLRVLGVPGQAIPDGIEQRAGMYRDRLAGRRVLVVLDDVADEGQVAPLLPGAHGCAVIATSRYRLTGLPGAHHVELDVFSETDALDMLGNIMGRKRLTDEPDAAKELVSLCGQLPLAIRIAAARLAARPHWSIRQLVSRLSDDRRRLDELVHRGLGVRSAIALGHDSLARPAALLFCRLGILTAEDFPGWAAGALLDDDGAVAEDLLESLVDARLVDAERRAGSTRYRLHDLVRVYARERIVIELSAAERSQSLNRLLAAWLCLAEHAHRRLYGGDYTVLHSEAPRWRVPPSTVDELLVRPLDWLEHERSGLVAAVGQAASAGFDDLCWDLAMTSVSLFEARGYFRDWRETHETALAAVGRSGNLLGQAAMRYSLGALNLVQHHMSEADGLLRQALRDFDELGHQHGRSLTLRNLGYLQRVQGRSEASWSTYQEALHGLRAVGDRVAEAHVLRSLATLELERSNHLEAEKLLGHALDIARKVGNSRLHAQVMHRNGEMCLSRGDLEAAEDAFRVTLQLVREIRDEIGEAYALYGLGNVHLRQGRRDPATGCLHRALVLAQENGERLLNGRVCLALSELYRCSGDLGEAARRAREAIDQFDRLGADGRLLQAPSDVTPHAEGGPETLGGTFRP